MDVWIKRDDLTGFALGGNKGRKLEYLVPEILAHGVTAVVTCGSVQSNFIRQLGAACRVIGVRCAAAVMALPYEPPAEKKADTLGHLGGNETLDRLFGVELRVLEDGTWDELIEGGQALAEDLRRQGEQVYEIPIGGSSVLSAYSFFRAADELKVNYDQIIVASSSGSTQVGLASAFRGTKTRVIGIACDPEPELPVEFAALAHELDGEPWDRDDLTFNMDYVGPGYGLPSEAGQAALVRLAAREGILLDPVYSAKAFAGLLDLGARGEIRGRTLFWHTGGLPTLFARGGVESLD
jgi:1-aminocyclopropane-1-carboxylate deaminase/D-cysteine desulfhydrase-like pyridoxal-dependent ACC family enzyme